ncbi:MAG: hypothetical protein WCP86_00070, partial [bacterium]
HLFSYGRNSPCNLVDSLGLGARSGAGTRPPSTSSTLAELLTDDANFYNPGANISSVMPLPSPNHRLPFTPDETARLMVDVQDWHYQRTEERWEQLKGGQNAGEVTATEGTECRARAHCTARLVRRVSVNIESHTLPEHAGDLPQIRKERDQEGSTRPVGERTVQGAEVRAELQDEPVSGIRYEPSSIAETSKRRLDAALQGECARLVQGLDIRYDASYQSGPKSVPSGYSGLQRELWLARNPWALRL